MFRTTFTLIFIFIFTSLLSFAGGIRGTIKNTKNEILSFATIQVKGTTKGTIANEEGKYELSLEAGSYEIVFQYLGHKTQTKRVEIKSEIITLDIILEEQSLDLSEVNVTAGREDPAYTIMRKTISMARYHLLETDSYSARTYVKGTGKIRDLSGPVKWIAGKKIEKETGLKIGQVYVMESINDVTFKQPGTIKEKIISKRDNFPAQLKSQGSGIINFGNINIYDNKSTGTMISPLSPSAFAYYRFKYEGEFEDRGVRVNKISVIPKSQGENVFTGTINVIEDTWAVHSLDVKFANESGKFSFKQLYSPFKDVWMPVYFESGFVIGALGIEFEGKYVTNVRDYNVQVNQKYHKQPTVIDEKIDKAQAKQLKTQKIRKDNAATQQQVTRKQARQAIKELEKEDKKEAKARKEDPDLVADYSLTVDSMATKRNNDFWDNERQVPLTETEVKGYKQADSINVAEAEKIKKDSIRNLPNFKITHLLSGHTYHYGKREVMYGYPRRLTLTMPLAAEYLQGNFYNSVEGYHINARIKYAIYNKYENRLETEGTLRYEFARTQLNGTVGVNYLFNQLESRIGLSAGRFVYQFNNENPITPFMNTFYSLIREENYMKLYEKTFVNATYNQRINEKLTLFTNLEFAQRDSLGNNHLKPWNDRADKAYTPNNPTSTELESSRFLRHNSLILNASIRFRPFAKAGKYNDLKYSINRRKPTFILKGKFGLLEESRFSQLELGYDQNWELQKLGDLHINARIGTFLDKPKYFIDYKHFNGNQTIFTSASFDSFRNLNYYQFSTAKNYFELHVNDDFQKLLLTSITPLRLLGLKENLFVNYLNAIDQGNRYVEVGYGLQGGITFLGIGVEVVGSFQNESYSGMAFRIKMPF
jgi:hypothetical protein